MPAAKPRFREIQAGDLDAIGDLLTRGFQYRSRDYWMRGLRRQGTRPLPPGEPRYGYLIENNGAPVGCLLTIYSSKTIDGETATCCNVSSWYVDPEFRNYAALFASMTQKRKDVTYLNVTPAVATWPILEAQGFKAYCRGFYFSLPVLARGGRGMTIEAVTAATASVEGLPDEDLEMLKRHAEYGCLALVCRTAQATLPFIFFPLRKRRGIIPLPALQLGLLPQHRRLHRLCRRDRPLSALARQNRLSSWTRPDPWRACPASTATCPAANTIKARTSLGWAISPTRNSRSSACEETRHDCRRKSRALKSRT